MGALTGLATTTLALTAFASTTLAVLIFPRRRVAPIARVQTAICWACALASLLLLPFDLGLGGSNSTSLRVFWHATHWVALLLGWLGTETLCEYYYAGEFDARSRARAAVRANLTFYGGVAALCAATALYLLVWLQLPARALLGVAAVLVDGYGLAVVALLQGHGLVALPRALWRTAAPRARLQRLHARLGALDGERHAAARRLRGVLARVRAADAAAPPPASRGARERECWEVVLLACRAAAEASDAEAATASERLGWSLRTAWSQTLGTPRKYSEPTLARMHRRVKAAALAAHTCRLRRRAALGRAVTLQRALVAVAKGFGGVGASEPDGTSILWLQVLRRPTLRLLAVVLAALSVYVLTAEAAAALLAAAPVLASLPGARPALALRAAAAARSPALAVALDFAVVCHLTACTYAALLSSALVAPLAIYPRKSSAPCLLRHSGWCVRLVLPLCSHYVATLVGGAADASAFSAALGTPWRPAQHAAAPPSPPLAPGAADPTAAAALSYHGLCSLVLVGVAAFAAAGGCGGGGGVCCSACAGCVRLLNCAPVDGSCLDGRAGRRRDALRKKGERIAARRLAALDGGAASSRSACIAAADAYDADGGDADGGGDADDVPPSASLDAPPSPRAAAVGGHDLDSGGRRHQREWLRLLALGGASHSDERGSSDDGDDGGGGGGGWQELRSEGGSCGGGARSLWSAMAAAGDSANWFEMTSCAGGGSGGAASSGSAIAPLPAVEAAAAEWNSLRSEYSADYTLTE